MVDAKTRVPGAGLERVPRRPAALSAGRLGTAETSR
jgi:hypothetical protein